MNKPVAEQLHSYPATPATPQRSVVLVIPPSSFLLDERVFASLGLLKVAASLEAAGHTVNLLDLSGIENFLEPLDDYFHDSDDFLVGITSTTPQLPATIEIAERIRALRPGLRRVLGGPHATLSYAARRLERKRGVADGRGHRAAAALEAVFDVIVLGDGERSVLDALADRCPRVLDGDDRAGRYFMNDAEYDATPLPARHLIDLPSYRYRIEGRPATSLIAQLGCPFSCGFCGGRHSPSLRVPRTRSIASIVGELELLHRDYGYTGFMFYDDELNVNPGLVELMHAICDLQARLGADFRLRGFVKAELFTMEQAEVLYQAGFRWLLCGFEAADERILKNIHKRATLDDNARAVEHAKAAGLKVKALMSVGHPGETPESVEAVGDWLIQMAIDEFDVTIITTYPGTPYYDEAVRHAPGDAYWTYTEPRDGDRLYSFDVDFLHTADYYKGDPSGGYRAYVFTDALSPEQLVTLRDRTERRVRERLGIEFNPARPAVRFEHSMGQGLPASILRRTRP